MRFVGVLGAALVWTALAVHAQFLVDWSTTFQTIEGFGISDAFNDFLRVKNFTSSQITLLFDKDQGIGLSLLRVKVPEDGSCVSPTQDGNVIDPIACAGGYAVSDIKNVLALGVKVWAAPWSPPAIYKKPESTIRSKLNPFHFHDYAQYLMNYAKNLKEVTGASLYALSVQNEPSSHVSYTSCPYTPAEMNAFISSALGPLFSGSGIRLIMPETASYGQFTKIWRNTINPYVSIVAFHGYDHYNIRTPNPYPTRSLWQTEVSGSQMGYSFFDYSIQDAVAWAAEIHQWLAVGNLNAWHFWWAQYHPLGVSENESLLSPNGTPAQRVFALGNFAKFLRPGYIRVGVTSSGAPHLFVSAYRAPNNEKTLVIVVVNENGIPLTETFQLKLGFQITTVTPWLTANNINLVRQTPFNVTYAEATTYDNVFSHTLPAMSVTTFYCQ